MLVLLGSCYFSYQDAPVELESDGRDRKVVAVNCEMVGGGSDGTLDVCARVCLVDVDECLIFHSYVKPVTNCRYETSGITEENLVNAMPLGEVQAIIIQRGRIGSSGASVAGRKSLPTCWP